MNVRKSGALALALACAMSGLGLTPQLAEAQRGPAPGGRGAPGDDLGLLEGVLGAAEAIGLSPEQTTRLREFQAQSAERTVEAREVLESWREEREAEREQAEADGAPDDASPGFRRGRFGRQPELTPDVRDALTTLAEERRAMMDELRATVTVEQMERIRELVGPTRPEGRADRVGPRGRAGRQRFRGRSGFRAPVFRGPAGGFAPARLEARRQLARQRFARCARRDAFR